MVLVNHANQDDVTALVFTITKGDLKIINFLLENKADINGSNQKGNTPLIFAIINAKLAVTKFLLEHGANINL